MINTNLIDVSGAAEAMMNMQRGTAQVATPRQAQAQADPTSQLVVRHTFLDFDETPAAQRTGATSTALQLPLRRVVSDSGLHALGQGARDAEVNGLGKISMTGSEDETVASDISTARRPVVGRVSSGGSSTSQERSEHGSSPNAAPYGRQDGSGFATPQPSDAAGNVEHLLAENARLALENQQLRQQFQDPIQARGCGEEFQVMALAQEPQAGVGMVWMPCELTNVQWMGPWAKEETVGTHTPCGRGAMLRGAGPRRDAYGRSLPCDSDRLPAHVQRRASARRAIDDKAHDVVTDVRREDRTTVMLRNLPNNYTRQMLLDMLDDNFFAGDYDFIYLPVDFRTKACLGYGFVNLVSAEVVPRFWQTFDGFSRWAIPSGKVGFVSWCGPHQGYEAHVERYRNSPVMHESVPDEYKPMVFRLGMRTAFPCGTKKSRVPRVRNHMQGKA